MVKICKQIGAVFVCLFVFLFTVVLKIDLHFSPCVVLYNNGLQNK
jgi:hypothetical protein